MEQLKKQPESGPSFRRQLFGIIEGNCPAGSQGFSPLAAGRLTRARRPTTLRAMRIALFQPDIPTNTGTIIRLGACMGVDVDIIEPCGFPFSDKSLRRAGMDYIDRARIAHHLSWEEFLGNLDPKARLVLLTTKTEKPYVDFAFAPSDVLLLGRESAGVSEAVHRRADARLTIPMAPGLRSLNVAVAASMVLGEALRQTNLMPSVDRTND